ncbi:MAG TPA: hypothetical protein DEB31_05890 [Clostridiales bacterium]|nr:hypothetical protein [Clostridiales bacterium]
MARKKKSADSGGGGANWMDTYGDLVTLLLCFFVLLFASSTISEEKWQAIVTAFTGSPANAMLESVNIETVMTSGIMQTQGLQQSEDEEQESPEEQQAQELTAEEQALQDQINEQINELYERLQQYARENNLESSLLLEREGMYINLTISEGILFDSGMSNIRDTAAEEILRAIGLMIREYVTSISVVTIEGHTDSDPIRNPLPGLMDNIDLSGDRAENVWRFMADESGIDRSMFRARGAAEYEPVASNDTPEGKQRNRRVRIVIMAKDAREVLAMAEDAGGNITAQDVVDVSEIPENTFSSE